MKLNRRRNGHSLIFRGHFTSKSTKPNNIFAYQEPGLRFTATSSSSSSRSNMDIFFLNWRQEKMYCVGLKVCKFLSRESVNPRDPLSPLEM